MTAATLSLKLQMALNHLDDIDDVFSQMEVGRARQLRDWSKELRRMIEREIEIMDQKALRNYGAPIGDDGNSKTAS